MLHIGGLVQDCSNSSALGIELLQSCTKPSICVSVWFYRFQRIRILLNVACLPCGNSRFIILNMNDYIMSVCLFYVHFCTVYIFCTFMPYTVLDMTLNTDILFYSILFYSIHRYSILFYSYTSLLTNVVCFKYNFKCKLFYSTLLLYSIYSIPLYSILFQVSLIWLTPN